MPTQCVAHHVFLLSTAWNSRLCSAAFGSLRRIAEKRHRSYLHDDTSYARRTLEPSVLSTSLRFAFELAFRFAFRFAFRLLLDLLLDLPLDLLLDLLLDVFLDLLLDFGGAQSHSLLLVWFQICFHICF